MHYYMQTGPKEFSVFAAIEGGVIGCGKFPTEEQAAARVHYLNGGGAEACRTAVLLQVLNDHKQVVQAWSATNHRWVEAAERVAKMDALAALLDQVMSEVRRYLLGTSEERNGSGQTRLNAVLDSASAVAQELYPLEKE